VQGDLSEVLERLLHPETFAKIDQYLQRRA
jgi:hypothetical protein